MGDKKMVDAKGFYTMKGYQINEEAELTPAMEDYLEMICRLMESHSVVRLCEVAEGLHVKPSSASKMIRLLSETGYLDAEKYGYILLTEKGRQAGDYLLYRHDVLQRFLCILNDSDNELEQVEKIEHFLDKKTVDNLNLLIAKLKEK